MQRNWHFRRRFVAVRGPTDVTAPTLSLPIDLPLSDTTAYLGVTTNEGVGTLYWVVTTSATPPSAAQVKAGQDHTGAAAAASGNQAVIATGAQVATATGLSSNTAYYAYFMQEDAVGNQSTVSAADGFTTLTTGTSDTSFDNLIAAMSVTPATLRQGYIAQCIQQLYAGNVWSKMDLLYVSAAHDEQAARLNWVSPSTFTLTAVNSPTFTTDRGFNGDRVSQYVNTGWDWVTNGVQYTQNDAHASACQRNNGNGNGILSPANSGYRTSVSGRNPGNLRINGSTNITGGTPTLPAMGIVRRNVSTDASVMFDGVQTGTVASTSTNIAGTSDFGFGGPNQLNEAQWCHGSLGAYLDDTVALAYYNAIHTYMIAVGADT